MNKSIILLSGGLDSVVSLALCIEKYNPELALTFNYGQKSFEAEYNASKNIAEYYSLNHKVIQLDWLKEISGSALTGKSDIPVMTTDNLNNQKLTKESAKSVWVPNRNALFINIAASFAEAQNYSHIIIGANKEEGETFKDNSKEFIKAINESLKNSINTDVQVLSPLENMNKDEIVKKGIELNIPFNMIYSCYNNTKKHCGKCESCTRLKRALQINNREDIIAMLF